ncbi:MAG: GNAT family N-acetyltransferase [Desulfatitalea sp.]|nr:GNAT family N-acetyltransferase [Desulfatitalea sp.]NNK02395.1 GNAT family N-acetyltransferase [Desulfatitalea sp.]
MIPTIRNATQQDLESLVVLLEQLFAIETDFRIDPVRHRRGVRLMLDGCGKHRCMKVAELRGAVVAMGSVQLLISTAEGNVVALLEDIVVDDALRRQGIGRQVMAALEQWAVQHGATRLQLLADRTNFSALDFYNTIGWVPTKMICLRRKMTRKSIRDKSTTQATAESETQWPRHKTNASSC